MSSATNTTTSTTCCSVYITAPDVLTATAIARAVVEERLAACANVLPGATSIYSWQGEVHEDAEVIVFLKTRAELFERLQRRVTELHPYDVPCVLQLPITDGAPAYLAWIREATTDP